MSSLPLATWLPILRPKAASVRGAAPGELAALQDRVIADLGLLWCHFAYDEHGSPPGPDDANGFAMSPPMRRLSWSES